MKLQVIIDFKDRLTKENHKVGDVIERDSERSRQLILSKNCIEKIEVETPIIEKNKNKKKNGL